jgi:DNA-binding transcriptional ArsR family regulator
LQQADAGEVPGLRVFMLDGVPYTSTRWIEHFLTSAPEAPTRLEEGEPLASGTPGPVPREAAEEGPDDEEEPPGLFDVDVPHSLDDEGPLALDAEDWERLDEDEEIQLVGGVLGAYSFRVAQTPQSGDPLEQDPGFLAFLAEHHPGLFWLVEGLVREGPLRGIPDTPAMLAREAGVSTSTISRYRRRARELYAAKAATATAARPDGRRARGHATQQRILAAIRDLGALYGRPPLFREVSQYLDISKDTLARHIGALKAAGLVRPARSGHGLELTEEAQATQRTPSAG